MTPDSHPAEDDFYARALGRIEQFMLVVGIVALLVACLRFGWRIGMGFALGGMVAYFNFHWLKKIVGRLAELTTAAGSPPASRGIVHRFILRYFLMALVAFVILTVSRESLYGLFGGLFLPVAAMFCEAAYEFYKAVSSS